MQVRDVEQNVLEEPLRGAIGHRLVEIVVVVVSVGFPFVES